jgi:hypothetical protein
MSDISKCSLETCPLKEHCYRFTTPANEYQQSYSKFQYIILEDGRVDCDGYWGSSTMRNKIKVDKNGKL